MEPRPPVDQALRLMQALEPLLRSDSDSTTIFSATLNMVRQVLMVERVSILLLQANEGYLRLRAAIGIPEQEWSRIRIPIGVGVAGRLVEDRVPILVPDIRISEFAGLARADVHYGSQGFMAAPIIIRGRVMGVLCATAAVSSPTWNHAHLDLLVTISGYLARAVDNAQITHSNQASLTHLTDVLTQVRVGLVTADVDGAITMMTLPARTMLGIHDSEAIEGLPVDELFRDPDGLLAANLAATLDYGTETVCEVRPGRPGSCNSPVEVVMIPLVDGEGQEEGALLTLTNLDLREEVKKLRELEELKSSFLATISHEFRTPLTALGGAVYLLDCLPLDQEAKSLVGILQRNTRRLNRLLGNLIELVQLQNGSIPFSARSCNLAEIVREILMGAAPSLTDRKLVLRTALDDAPLIGDATLLGQACSELLDNAIKFSPVGGTMAVSTGCDPDGVVWFEVRDSGPGVDQTLRRSLFEGFQQSEHYMTRSISGLGLGLNLAWRLVRLHGGRLEEHGQSDTGAIFRAILPPLPGS
jgi:signal transduction histidine kinase